MSKLAITDVEQLLDCLGTHVRNQLTFQLGFECWQKLEHPLEKQLADQFGDHIRNSLGHQMGLSEFITSNMASP